jgi:thiol-disulfide isomerase/thioredoxin
MKLFTSILASLALLAGIQAADKKDTSVPNAKLSDYHLGELITGPAVDLANTGGKAVVIEAWGVHCGPCLASLPHMEQLAKANKNDTIFVGAHSQDASDDEVKAVVKKNRLTYSIVKGVNGPGGTGTIPQAYVFDTTGTLIYCGSPLERGFDTAVRKAGRPATTATR